MSQLGNHYAYSMVDEECEIATISLIDFRTNSSNEFDNFLLQLFTKQIRSKPKYNMKTIRTFEDFNLNSELLKGLYEHGMEKPSEIQRKCIMPIISSQPPVDVVVCARTGTGKTTAYSISLLDRIFPCFSSEKGSPQALVIVPPTMLAYNVTPHIQKIGKRLDVKVLLLEGTSRSQMQQSLNEIQHVIVGTPGKILLSLKQGLLKLDNLKIVVLDEFEDILNMGFINHIKEIVQSGNPNLQICIICKGTSIDGDVNDFIEEELRDPVKIIME